MQATLTGGFFYAFTHLESMKNKLPLFELLIDDDETLVNAVSLVENPAIESDFIFFSKDSEQILFANNDKQEILGAALIPDTKIFRRDKSGYEYEVFFTKETVRKIAQKYFKEGFQHNLNLHHSSIPAHSFIFQSYITDKAKGIYPPKEIAVPDGSWIVGVKIENSDVWKKVKSGEVKGFSIEGVFDYDEKFKANKSFETEILKTLNKINTLIKKQYTNEN